MKHTTHKRSKKRGPYKNTNGHNTLIAVRLKDSHRDTLRKVAANSASTISQFVRKLIEREIATFQLKAKA